jgi:hypothetical protein
VLAKPPIDVREVSADEYRESVQRAQKYAVRINDALALIVMEQQGIDEICTFGRHFERTPVRCVQEYCIFEFYAGLPGGLCKKKLLFPGTPDIENCSN